MAIRKTAILIFIICSSLITKGDSGDTNQLNKNNRFSVGGSIGAALPFLGFGVPGYPNISQYNTSYYGYAKTGLYGGITANVIVSNNRGIEWGFTGAVYANINPFNTTAYANNILYTESTTASVKANNYNTDEYLFGLFVKIPLTKKHPYFFFKYSTMLGSATINFPTIVTTYSTPSGQSELSGNGEKSIDLNLEAGFEDKITKCLVVSLDFSSSFSYVKFSSCNYTQTMQGSPTLTVQPPNSEEFFMGLLKPAVGISYIF